MKITISRAKVRACRRIDCRSVERVSAPVLQRFTQRPREKGRENKRGSAPVTKRGSSEGARRAHGGRRNIDRGREGMEEGETPSPPWSCCHRVGFQSSLPLGTRQAGTCFSKRHALCLSFSQHTRQTHDIHTYIQHTYIYIYICIYTHTCTHTQIHSWTRFFCTYESTHT